MQPNRTVKLKPGDIVRIVLPHGSGAVEITTGLFAEGNPRTRVDVTSDQPRYGATAKDGYTYTVENGDPGPGVVFLTGHLPTTEEN